MAGAHAVRDAVADHEQHAVHVGQQHERVAHAEHGRGVDDDVRISGPGFLEEIDERRPAEQFGGMRGNAPRRQQVQLRDAGRGQRVPPTDFPGEHFGQAAG